MITRRNLIKSFLVYPLNTVKINKITTNKNNLVNLKNESNLPLWFLENRIQGHIRFPLIYLIRKISPLQSNVLLKKLGITIVTRHFKSADENAWWYTKFGRTHKYIQLSKKEIAKEIIDSAHKINLKIIAYYRHMEDKYIAKEHPDWLCRNWKGNPIKTLTKRGYHLCFNSPYREIVKGRLVELAKMGVDGLYFDEDHMPRDGCWCNFCREKFKQEYGLEPPKKPDPKDVIWAKYYVEFNNRTVEETFIEWKKAVKNINPNVVFIISLHLYPTLLDHHLSSRLMTIADSVKSEIFIPIRKKTPKKKNFIFDISKKEIQFNKEVKLSLGYTLINDGSQGKPAHVWIPNITQNNIPYYKKIYCILTYGNIANVDINENLILNSNNTSITEIYKKIFSLNKELSHLFKKRLKKLSNVRLYFPEYIIKDLKPNYKEIFNEVIFPFYKSYELCFYKKIPVQIYTDYTLSSIISEQITKVDILFTPFPSEKFKKMKNELEIYNKKGGKIITNLKDFYLAINKIQQKIKILPLNKDFFFHYNIFMETSDKKIYIFLCKELFNQERKIIPIKIIFEQPIMDYKIIYTDNSSMEKLNNKEYLIMLGEFCIISFLIN